MKTRLNLYTAQFRSQSLLVDRRTIGYAVAVALLMLVVMGTWLSWINHGLDIQHRKLTDEQVRLENRMLEISKKIGARAENKALQLAIFEASKSVSGKRQLIQRLNNSPLLADTRFSHFMRGLSSSHVEGLWLTRVRADGTSLILDGRSLSEDLVPRWIHQLSMRPEFSGRKFGVLELLRSQDETADHLDFHLSTGLEREETENG